MKNNQIYLNLDEQLAAFNKYCDSQPSCPCKFGSEHCELKWLHEETKPISSDVDYREKILEILKKNNQYAVVWHGSPTNQIVINKKTSCNKYTITGI